MLQRWERWNHKAKLWLWLIVIIGVIVAIPLGIERMGMEKTSDKIELVFDYRDIIEVAELQPRPQQFLDEHLRLLKEAGVTTMAVYESTLRELMQAGRLVYYNSKEAALLQGRLEDERVNFTYILFSGEREEQLIGPIVREAFDRMEVPYREWSYNGRGGLIVEQSMNDANLKVMDFDPISLQAISEAGFHILPRFSDRVVPYDSIAVEAQLARLSQYGVTRVLFDGEKAKGVADQTESRSLDSFGELLKQYNIGITVIENLKKPQQGINKLAYITNYNVARLYSLSPEEGMAMSPEAIVDRFVLAAKDRNIRMFFLNSVIQSNADKGKLDHSVEKLGHVISGEGGVIEQMKKAGFELGAAEAFTVDQPAWSKPLRAVIAVSAVALITLLIAAFIPGVAIPVFFIGLVGSAGIYVVFSSSLMEQALALGAAVSAPTLALIWVMNRIYARTIGERRLVGGEEWKVGGTADSRLKWIFPHVPMGKRLGIALNWFVVASAISLSAVPVVFGLLYNITYNLVLEQFRGVSVLHFAPIGLVALYVFFYDGGSYHGVIPRIRKLLSQPITVLWVVVAAVLGAVGVYYLSRTGNAGQTLPLEPLIRGWLESTFGVRPRFKEFMLGHPLLLLGLFLALRYRVAWVLIIAGSIGQLTMVSTFTHLHTPLYISIVRTLLGMGAGIIVGCLLIALWTIVEGAWRRWVPATSRKLDA